MTSEMSSSYSVSAQMSSKHQTSAQVQVIPLPLVSICHTPLCAQYSFPWSFLNQALAPRGGFSSDQQIQHEPAGRRLKTTAAVCLLKDSDDVRRKLTWNTEKNNSDFLPQRSRHCLTWVISGSWKEAAPLKTLNRKNAGVQDLISFVFSCFCRTVPARLTSVSGQHVTSGLI